MLDVCTCELHCKCVLVCAGVWCASLQSQLCLTVIWFAVDVFETVLWCWLQFQQYLERAEVLKQQQQQEQEQQQRQQHKEHQEQQHVESHLEPAAQHCQHVRSQQQDVDECSNEHEANESTTQQDCHNCSETVTVAGCSLDSQPYFQSSSEQSALVPLEIHPPVTDPSISTGSLVLEELHPSACQQLVPPECAEQDQGSPQPGSTELEHHTADVGPDKIVAADD
eukprot:jgi/Chrzof1/7721/Cz02g34070.t1